MVDRIEFELVSPEALLMSLPVEMVVVPGSEGYYGVLRMHIPMITTLKPGVVEIYNDGRVMDRIFVSGGFAEVQRTRVTVLVEAATKIGDLDREQVTQSIKNLEEDLEDAETPEDKSAVEARLEVAKAKLQAIELFVGPSGAH